MLEIKVERTTGSFPVFVGYHLQAKAEEILKLYNFKDKILVLTSSGFEAQYQTYLQPCLKPFQSQISLRAVDKKISLETAYEIIADLAGDGFTRQSAIISLGGIGIQSLGGFIARIFKHGITFISIPTTLAAQLKGVVIPRVCLNVKEQFAAVSVEHFPTFAWLDVSILSRHSRAQITSGLLEAIRISIIKDARLFEFIEHNLDALYRLDPKSILYMVHKACLIRSKILSKATVPQENPGILNFGEIVEFVLKTQAKHWQVSEIEAQFLGIFIETILAYRQGFLDGKSYKRIEQLLLRLNLKVLISKINFDELKILLDQSSDHYEQFAFPTKIGEVTLVNRKITEEK